MHLRRLLAGCLLLTASAPVLAAEREIPVICQHGALHTMPLVTVPAGTPGSHRSHSVRLGPARTVWIELPSGTALAPGQREPVPVRDLDTPAVQLQVSEDGDAVRELEVAVHDEAREGRSEITLVRARMEAYHYALPEGCRMLSRDERHDYAKALLNNAGCLLPAALHRSLDSLPGAPEDLRHDCGWAPDARLALHLMAKAADRGSLEAGWLLSQLHLGNVTDEFRNLRAAYLQFARTGGLGHASADLMTGIMRWLGHGVAQRSAGAAFPVLLPHARSGVREAQGIIGTMYLTGDGVPANPIQAYAWCSLASEGAPLMYTDPVACRDSAEDELSYDAVLEAHDLAVAIHNGDY